MTEEGKIMMKNYLSHHGIQGQHWGVKNGPPYPLKPEVSQKIQKKGAEDKAYRDKREKLKKGDKRVKSEGISHETSRRDQYLKDVAVWDVGNGKVNVNTLANELYENEAKGKSYLNDQRFKYADIRDGRQYMNNLYDNPNIISNFANRVNAGRFGKEGYSNNCSKCSSSFIMNLKGYNCIAGKSLDGNLNTADEYWWDGATTYKEYSGAVQSRIDKFGRRGCGTIGIRYKNGGGHSFNFVTDGHGNTKYVNSQTGDVLDGWGQVLKFFGGNIDENQRIRITNLTTATPNFKHMAEDDVINYDSNTIRSNNAYRGTSSTYDRSNMYGAGRVTWDKYGSFW